MCSQFHSVLQVFAYWRLFRDSDMRATKCAPLVKNPFLTRHAWIPAQDLSHKVRSLTYQVHNMREAGHQGTVTRENCVPITEFAGSQYTYQPTQHWLTLWKTWRQRRNDFANKRCVFQMQKTDMVRTFIKFAAEDSPELLSNRVSSCRR